MTYSETEKNKMDGGLKAFRAYVASSRSMDVAYSEKTGYVRLIIAEFADSFFFPIRTADELLEMFFYDILCDQVELALARNPALTNATMGYDVVRSLIAGYLDGLGREREHAMNKLDQFLNAQRKRDTLP